MNEQSKKASDDVIGMVLIPATDVVLSENEEKLKARLFFELAQLKSDIANFEARVLAFENQLAK